MPAPTAHGRFHLAEHGADIVAAWLGGTVETVHVKPDQDFVDDAARTADANRAVVFTTTSSGGATTLLVTADSRRTGLSEDVVADDDRVA